jgi:hypothetical protein
MLQEFKFWKTILQKKSKKYDDKKESDKVKDFLFDQLNLSIDFNFGFPLSLRNLNNSSKCFYDKATKSLYFISKPFLRKGEEFLKLEKMEVKMANEKSPSKTKGYHIFDWRFLSSKSRCHQKVDDEKVLFTEVHLLDVGGWMNSDSIFKKIVKQRGEKYRDSLFESIERIPKGTKLEDAIEELKKTGKLTKYDELFINTNPEF